MIELLTNYNIIGMVLALTMLIVGSVIDVWKRIISTFQNRMPRNPPRIISP